MLLPKGEKQQGYLFSFRIKEVAIFVKENTVVQQLEGKLSLVSLTKKLIKNKK